MKKNILIVGGSGFVGKALASKLYEKGENIFLTSRDKKFKTKKGRVFYGNLEDSNFCEKILKNIDTVYYLASFKKNISVHTSIPFNVLSGNVLPLLNFLKALKDSKVKDVVYVSSSIVEYFSKEEMIDGYVYGKYINELIIKSFISQTKIPIKIVRSAAIYGPGNDFDPKTANLIPSLIVKVKESKDEVVLWGKGIRELQFIYIDDLIDNLIAILSTKNDFFVIGNFEKIKIKDILRKVIKLMDKKLKVRHDLTKPDKKTQLTKFNNKVAPKVNIDKGIKNTIEYYLKNYA